MVSGPSAEIVPAPFGFSFCPGQVGARTDAVSLTVDADAPHGLLPVSTTCTDTLYGSIHTARAESNILASQAAHG